MALSIDARTECIPAARGWVTARARDCGASPALVARITLLASELITNAVSYGPAGGTVAVRADRVDGVFRVEVDDGTTDVPRVRHPGPEQFGGRGMLLVDTYATRWGHEPRDGAGKTVWFEAEL